MATWEFVRTRVTVYVLLVVMVSDTCIRAPAAETTSLILVSSGMDDVAEAECDWNWAGVARAVNVRSLNTLLVSSASSDLLSVLVEAAFRVMHFFPSTSSSCSSHTAWVTSPYFSTSDHPKTLQIASQDKFLPVRIPWGDKILHPEWEFGHHLSSSQRLPIILME